jgi:hypothetical protein
MTAVGRLYEVCEEFDNANIKLDSVRISDVFSRKQHNLQLDDDFNAILAGISADARAKKLSVQLRFRYFSTLADQSDEALDTLFALYEDSDISVSEHFVARK